MASSRHSRGFTVIELLAAMTVLIFMVGMLTRVFTETSRIWGQSSAKVQTAVHGRAIMDFIVREMTQAIADDVVSFKINSPDANSKDDRPIFGTNVFDEIAADEVFFVAPVRLATGPQQFVRNAHQFVYFVTNMEDSKGNPMDYRYRLVRRRKTASMWDTQPRLQQSAYGTNEWWKYMDTAAGAETIAENVVGFELWAYALTNGYPGGYAYNSVKQGNILPAWADLYLELLGEDEAKRAAILWQNADKEAAKDYIAQNVRRFNARVYFPNRERAFVMNE